MTNARQGSQKNKSRGQASAESHRLERTEQISDADNPQKPLVSLHSVGEQNRHLFSRADWIMANGERTSDPNSVCL